ncbi:MAG TPA: DUF1800 domain-containing protein [Myxococcaceae bacterium]|nr:DUF1800 domain-containing protein [Myxococcaceae bacterium]
MAVVTSRLVRVATAAIALAGCSSQPKSPPALTLAPDAVRLAAQATFGPTVAVVRDIEQRGAAAWIDAQLAQAPSDLGTYTVVADNVAAVCPTGSPSTCYRDNFTPFLTETAFFRNALSGPDQLRQRVAFALSQVVVVSGAEVRPNYAVAEYEKLLLRDAFGTYRQLLEDVTLSPAMGRYLNMVNNDKPNAAKGTEPNENYAREIMQLFSIGLVQLGPDGSVVTDGSGAPVPTYDQNAVIGLAHVFTGWTYPLQPGATQKTHNAAYYLGPMVVVASNHDTTAKVILGGTQVPAGQTPDADLALALDTIANHPNVAPFIGKQLIQALVTANPTPAYVARISAVWADDGHGVRGNLGAVVRAILLDSEARGDVKTDSTYGRVKDPVLLLTGPARALGVTTDGVYLAEASSALEQPPYLSPTVFNFYPPDYTSDVNLVSPASALLDSGSVFTRANATHQLLYAPPGRDTSVTGSTGTQIDLGDLAGYGADPGALVDSASALFLHGTLSSAERSKIVDAVNAQDASDLGARVRAAVYLVLTSPQYQVER